MATYWENSCSFGLRYVSWYKCLVVGLVFSRLGFWSGNLFLIAPFPDLCLLVPSCDYFLSSLIGTHLLIEIIDAPWFLNTFYSNFVCALVIVRNAFYTSFACGLLESYFLLPCEKIKSRLQNQRPM